jgi:hypothetical protein
MEKSSYERLNELTKEAAKKYPRLGLTSGYIGNVYDTGPLPDRDDREWYVFTKVYNWERPGKYKSPGFKTKDLDKLILWAETKLDEWASKIPIPID